jgi:hypothetical protein
MVHGPQRGLAFWAAVAVAAGLLAAPGTAPAQAAPACAGVAPTQTAALALATSCGVPVVVDESRSEFSQVVAQPDGRLRLESAVEPQRVRRSAGWTDIDLDLRRRPDGLWAPGATMADVRFSGGGSTPLVTLVRGGRTFTMSWPGGLPTPSVVGDSATYADVLAGVDLVVRATRTGFTHVLVVKTRQAAADSALRQISFDMGGDARLVRLPGGGLRAEAGRVVLASSQPAVMWDSSASSVPSGAKSGAVSPGAAPAEARSTPAGPGDAAATADVAAEVTGDGDLRLRPDPEFLTADTTVFPVYVDPPWSTYRSKWAYATNNNSNNTDLNVSRVGRDPNSGILYRSYFDFAISAIRGKHIEDAHVQMKLDHSYSCGGTPTSLFFSRAIATYPRTKWAPGWIKDWGTANSHANETGGCGDVQPDMTVNFISPNIITSLQQQATNQATGITVGLCACDANGSSNESIQERWKKFWPGNAKLIVDYSSYPGKPHSLQVAGVACQTTGRTTIGELTPTLSAIYPDADGTQALRTQFEWLEIPASGIYNDSTPRKPAPPATSVPANGRSVSAEVSVQLGKAYAFRTRATDPAPYNLTSAWSSWCEFSPDTSVPQVTVVPVSEATLPTKPGTPGTFTISSTATDVTAFRYGWTGPPSTTVAATGTTTKSATVTVTAPKYGLNILYVSAVDSTGNEGFNTYEFTVNPPSVAVARWGLESYPGKTQAQALDDQSGDLAGDTPLTGTLLSWTPNARLVGGQTVTFNGGGSQAVASGLVPNTTESFSAAAWVRLRNTSGTQTFISKDGGAGGWSTFRLTMANGTWCFTMNTSQTTGDHTYLCTAAGTAVANRWTHVAGSYDKAEKKIRLWVDGAAYEKAFTAPPVTTSGPIVLGRAMNAGSPADRTYGDVADVQFFDRVLVIHDFTGKLADDDIPTDTDQRGILDTIQVGDWGFADESARCYQELAEPGVCEAPEFAPFGRRLAFTQGTDVGYGHRGNGILLDRTHFTEDPTDPYYGLTTTEYGRTQDNTNGDPGNPVWQDGPVLRTDESFTVSAWVRLERFGPTMTAVAQAGNAQSAFYLSVRKYAVNGVDQYGWAFNVTDLDDDIGENAASARMTRRALTDEDLSTWTHLVGVYDSSAHKIRLYVNGKLEATEPWQRPFHATGPLTVGAARWSPDGELPRWTDFWEGGIDDLGLYQGAMSDAAASLLFDEQTIHEQP